MTEVIFGELNRYLLVAIPLFAFMAHVMIRSAIVDDLYDTAYTLTRHLPGGLGIATIAACTIFAAISGSSVATALTIGAVAIPQMLRFGYPPRMAYGLVAAGGTLGILIPPSGPMVLYGVTTDTSIGGLFMAGDRPRPDDGRDLRRLGDAVGLQDAQARQDRAARRLARSAAGDPQVAMGDFAADFRARRHVRRRVHRHRGRCRRRCCWRWRWRAWSTARWACAKSGTRLSTRAAPRRCCS